MKADPATLSFVRSVLDGLPVKDRETLLAPYVSQSSPAPSAAGLRDLMTVAEAADYLRCSRSSLWRMEQDGELQAVYVRGKKLFRLADLQAALTQKPTKGE